MAEIIQKDGTWVFDGDALRLTPGRDKNVSLLRPDFFPSSNDMPANAASGTSSSPLSLIHI